MPIWWIILSQVGTLGIKVVEQYMRCRHGILQSKACFPLLQTISSEVKLLDEIYRHTQDNLQLGSTVCIWTKNPVRSTTGKHSLTNSIIVQSEFPLNILIILEWFSTESRRVHIALLVSTQFWRRYGFIRRRSLFVRKWI